MTPKDFQDNPYFDPPMVTLEQANLIKAKRLTKQAHSPGKRSQGHGPGNARGKGRGGQQRSSGKVPVIILLKLM